MKIDLFEPSNYYHVFNRGNNRENIFKCHDNYLYFLNLVEKYLSPICDVHAYCLLPNHFHLLIKMKDQHELPDMIIAGRTRIYQPFSNLFNAYAKAINKKYGRVGSLFQKGLKKKKIKNEKYLKASIIYIHRNPSEHNIADFEVYSYSSYQEIVSSPEIFEKNAEMKHLFNDIENFKYVHSNFGKNMTGLPF